MDALKEIVGFCISTFGIVFLIFVIVIFIAWRDSK
jgi:hypothetical protein